MGLEISPASEADYAIVSNLARFYIYDIAEHAGLNFPTDGLFDSEDQFANYWGRTGARRAWPSAWRGFPFLLRIDGHPAGFALLKRIMDTPATFDMGEFFIARQYRRLGFGKSVATTLFDCFAGAWEVREMPMNTPAQAFWRKIIADYTAGSFTEAREAFAVYGDKEFIVQRFLSRAAQPPD
ncbi:MAG: GNAT family N-acetyltransferase [Bradyrhizobium sp.]